MVDDDQGHPVPAADGHFVLHPCGDSGVAPLDRVCADRRPVVAATTQDRSEYRARIRRVGAEHKGSFSLVFGYFNRNWEEAMHLPVGENNTIEPGGPDRGQPTYFHPRRNQFIFRVRVPKDFGKKELVWTLTSHGKTERVYGTLAPDYLSTTSSS